MHRGKFIVIDGGEGAGKTSILATAKKFFGSAILTTREAGGTPFAEHIRDITHREEYKNICAESFFGLIWAARADHVKSKIAPALNGGISVISDRFDSSTYAYQLYGQDGRHLEKLFWKTSEVFLNSAIPDLYVFLDVAPEIGLRRISKRVGEKTHFDNRDLDFHRRVHKGFRAFFKKVPHKVIDASQPLEKVADDFLAIVETVIKQ